MQEWLTAVFGESAGRLLTVVLAAAVVVVLALVLVALAKRILAGSGGIGGRSRTPRLAVMEFAAIDPKRRIVLVRRDDTEHLILIGGQNDLVIEPGIRRAPPQRRAQARPDGQPRREPDVAPPALAARRFPVRPGADEDDADETLPAPEAATVRPAPPVVAAAPEVAPERHPRSAPSPEREAMPPVVAEDPSPRVEPPLPVPTRAPRATVVSPPEPEMPSPSPSPSPVRPPVAEERRATMPTPTPGAEPGRAARTNPSSAVSVANGRQHTPPVPATAPAVMPVTPPAQVAPPTAPTAPETEQSPQPVAQPRSMATPTLPNFGREPAAAPPPPPQPSPATRSFWSTEALVPLPAERVAAPRSEPVAAQPAVEAPVPPPVRSEEERQPLSVRSFATTIQARKPSYPVEKSADEVRPAASAPPPRPAPGVSTPAGDGPAERIEPELPAPGAPQNAAQPPETAQRRPMTLEEEMERLLHDFTIDVSDRR